MPARRKPAATALRGLSPGRSHLKLGNPKQTRLGERLACATVWDLPPTSWRSRSLARGFESISFCWVHIWVPTAPTPTTSPIPQIVITKPETMTQRNQTILGSF